METLLFLVKVFIISFSGAVSPGPVTAATLAASTKYKHAGILVSTGHALVEFPLIIIILLGASKFLKTPAVQIPVGLLGGIVLFTMGIGLFKDCLKNIDYQSDEKLNYRPIRAGALLSLSNPYLIVWWATIGLNLIMEHELPNIFEIAAFMIAHWLSDFVWLEFLSFSSYHGTKALGDISRKVVFAICSVALFFFGTMFIMNSGSDLLKILNN